MFHGPLLILGGSTGQTACHFHEFIVLGSCSVLSSKLWCCVPPRCWVSGAHVDFWRTHGANTVSLSWVYSVEFWMVVLCSMSRVTFRSLQCCVPTQCWALNDGVAFLLSVELDGRMLLLGGPTGLTACHFHESIVLGSCSVLSFERRVAFLHGVMF